MHVIANHIFKKYIFQIGHNTLVTEPKLAVAIVVGCTQLQKLTTSMECHAYTSTSKASLGRSMMLKRVREVEHVAQYGREVRDAALC